MKRIRCYKDGINADGPESMFLLKILEKIKETRLKFS